MSLGLPAKVNGAFAEVVCENLFVYKSNVGDHVIVGDPFCKAYGLTMDPMEGCLVDALQVSRMLRAVPEGSGPPEHVVLCAIVQAVSACFCSFEDREMMGHFGADGCSCVVCVSLRSLLCPTQLFSAG